MVIERDDVVGLDSVDHPAAGDLGGVRPRRDVQRPARRVPLVPQAVPRRPPAGGRRGEAGQARATSSTPTTSRSPRSSAPTAAPEASGPSRASSTACSRPSSASSRTSPACTTCARRPRRASSSTSSTSCNSSRRKPPFGIAQIGKSFRNEITPGNFIFRTREFEQMEMEYFVKPGEDEEWHQRWIDERTAWYIDLGINPDNLRHFEHPKEKLSPLLEADRRHRVPVQLHRLGVGRARGHRQPHRLRPDHALAALGHRPRLLRPDDGGALHALRHRAGCRPVALADDVPRRRLRRGRGAQHQGWRRQAGRAAARPAAGPGQGRGAAAVAQRRPVAQGARPGGPAAAAAGTSTSTTPAPSASGTAARTRSVRRTASRSTSTPSRTRR